MDGVSVVLQAGGESRRMGRDKALVEFDGMPLYRHILRQVEGLGDELFIISNNPQLIEPGVSVVGDVRPGLGALGGLYTALVHAKHEKIVLLGCDMPFVHVPLIRHLVDRLDAHNCDVAIPQWQPEHPPESFRAVYRKSVCVEGVGSALDKGLRRMTAFHSDVRVLVLTRQEIEEFDPQGLTFVNVNTPEELEAAQRLIPEFRDMQAAWRDDD